MILCESRATSSVLKALRRRSRVRVARTPTRPYWRASVTSPISRAIALSALRALRALSALLSPSPAFLARSSPTPVRRRAPYVQRASSSASTARPCVTCAVQASTAERAPPSPYLAPPAMWETPRAYTAQVSARPCHAASGRRLAATPLRRVRPRASTARAHYATTSTAAPSR